jgi:hypothetical protein
MTALDILLLGATLGFAALAFYWRYRRLAAIDRATAEMRIALRYIACHGDRHGAFAMNFLRGNQWALFHCHPEFAEFHAEETAALREAAE